MKKNFRKVETTKTALMTMPATQDREGREYFHKAFRMIVAEYKDLTKLLPYNMGLSML